MNVRRIFKVVQREVRSGFRDSMMIMLLVMPLVMAVVVIAVAPKNNDIVIKFAVTGDMEDTLVEAFDTYGQVEILGTEEAVVDRVEQIDELIGVVKSGPDRDDYTIILQGNENEGFGSTAAMILDEYFGKKTLLFDVEVDGLGLGISPFREAASLFLMLFVLAIPGFMAGLSLVEEKETNTMGALNVSPLTIPELVIGKAFFGAVTALVQIYIVMLIMGLAHVNMWMVLVMWLPGMLSGTVLGFLIGVIAKDQIGAIGMMKFSFLPLMVSYAGALFIAEKWQFFLWWSPFYWMYKAFEGVFTMSAGWGEFGFYAALTLVLSSVFLLVSSRKIRAGLRSV